MVDGGCRNMKRIIDISEKDYNHLCFLHEDDIYKIVENSTPLNEVEADDYIPREVLQEFVINIQKKLYN